MTDEPAPAVTPGDADEPTVAAVPPTGVPPTTGGSPPRSRIDDPEAPTVPLAPPARPADPGVDGTPAVGGGTASPTLGEQTVDLRSYVASTTPAPRVAASETAEDTAEDRAEDPAEDTAEDRAEDPAAALAEDPPAPPAAAQIAPWRRLSSAGALIWVLIALFGFTLVVQLRSNDTDQGLSTMRQEDLVRILSDLEARETRLNSEISSLEESQRQLTSGVQGRQAALEEAERRANELGLLAGTLPGRGPGLLIRMQPGGEPIKASAVLNTVQELRGAGGEAMQIAGANGVAVRVVASTAFVDGDGGTVVVDGRRLTAPYVFTVIGAPQTMETALNIPGGVVASVGNVGGTVIAEQRKAVEVTAVRGDTTLQYARPVS